MQAMKTRGFLIGLAGGIVGAALVLAVALALGLTHVTNQTVLEQTSQSAPVTFGPTEGMTPQQIFQKSAPGVVEIKSIFGAGSADNLFLQPSASEAVGSGFVVSADGYILTNQHVVVDQNSGQPAQSVTVGFKRSGNQIKEVKAKVVGSDATSDVALLKVDPSGLSLHPLSLGNSDQVQVGEPVVAIGNPLQLDFSLTAGIVSAVGRDLQSPNGRMIANGIQTDAAINPGNSGGPLIDAGDQVIGINEQIATQSGGNQGLGFAVPINLAIKTMGQLKQFGMVKYPWLGIRGQTITADLAKLFNLPVNQGVLLASVEPGQPAAKAGLKGGTQQVTVQGTVYTIGGDIITAIDGKKMASIDDLGNYISGKKAGDQVTITYMRGTTSHDVKVTLAPRPAGV
jgi:S1-C subfamily serine protease